MNLTKMTLAAVTVALGFTLTAAADDSSKLPPASTKQGVTFDADIKPIFDASCAKCHTEGKKPKGHLALDSLAGTLKGTKDGKVVTAGDSAHSDLVLAVAHVGDPDTFMPKGKDAKKLSDDQIGLIRAWIDQGAK
jgi:mono/diheme cytochrome c family protein